MSVTVTGTLADRPLYLGSVLVAVTVMVNPSAPSKSASSIALNETLCWVCQFAAVKVRRIGAMPISSPPVVQIAMVTLDVGAAARAIRSVSPAPPSVTPVDPPLWTTTRAGGGVVGASKVTVRIGPLVVSDELNANPSALVVLSSQP